MKYILICIAIICLSACHKIYDNTNQVNKIILPAFSENGAGTFGFIFNKSVWTVFGKHLYRAELADTWLDNTFEVTSLNTSSHNQYQLTIAGGGRMSVIKNDSAFIDISAGFNFTPTIPYIKSYYLTNNPINNFMIADFVANKYYQVDSLKPLTLQLTKFDKIDSLTRICSGRFFGILYNETDKNDSIVITDGRFDTKVIFP